MRSWRPLPAILFSSSLSIFYPCVQSSSKLHSHLLSRLLSLSLSPPPLLPLLPTLSLFFPSPLSSFLFPFSTPPVIRQAWNRARLAAKASFFSSLVLSLRELRIIEFFCIGSIFNDGNMLSRILYLKSINEFFIFYCTLNCTSYRFGINRKNGSHLTIMQCAF